VEFSSDGECLACGSDDGIVRLWNGRNGRLTLLEGHTHYVSCVSFSPDTKSLASGSYDRSIRLWKLDDKSHRLLLVGHNAAIISIAFSPSGSSLASGCSKGEVRLWDIDDGRCVRTITIQNRDVLPVAFSPDGATLATGGFGKSICLWDLEADDDSSSPSSIIETNWLVAAGSLAYSRNGIYLASVGDQTVKIWRASDGSLEKVLRGHNFLTASLSPNGKLVASGEYDGSGAVRLWSVNDGDANYFAVSPHFHRHEWEDEDGGTVTMSNVRSIAFTPNGQNLASAGDDGIFLWDTHEFL
jgi:WD40 repeat protein